MKTRVVGVLLFGLGVALSAGQIMAQNIPQPQPQGGAPIPLPKAATPAVAAPQVKAAPSAPVQLRVVGKDQFCSRMSQAFTQFGVANGYDKVQSTVFASGATSRIVQDFKTGRASDYISAPALIAAANLPQKNVSGYFPTAQVVGKAMGVSDQVMLALSPGELRFIPHIQQGSDLVVVASNAAAVTPERANKVAEVARNMGIRISILWVGAAGDDRQDIEEARMLAMVAATTGGAFANLGGTENPCSPAL